MKDPTRDAIVQQIYSEWNTYKVGMHARGIGGKDKGDWLIDQLADLRTEVARNPIILLRKELAAFHSQWATCNGVAVMPPLGDLLVLVHDDGPCADGSTLTPLIDGYCPVCKFSPDMQSTSFIRGGAR